MQTYKQKPVIIMGQGMVCGMTKKNEPNSLYIGFISQKGKYKTGDTVSVEDIDKDNVMQITFDDIETPLHMARGLINARILRKPIVDLGGFMLDFTSDETGESWDIATSYFLTVARKMVFAEGMDKNDFAVFYSRIVGH